MEFNEIISQYPILSGIGATLGAAIAGFISFRKKIKSLFNKLMPKKNKVTREEILRELQDLSYDIDGIKNRVDDIDGRQKDDEFVNTIKYKVKQVINSIIDSYPEIDNDIESLLIDGADKAAELFIEIKRNGYDNITNQYIKRTAIQKLKTLNNNYANCIDNSLQMRIKSEIAYPAINRLLSDLQAFKKGIFNGKTDDKFLKLSLHFVTDFANKAITIYEQEYNK